MRNLFTEPREVSRPVAMKWFGRTLYWSFAVSMLIAVLFSDDTLQNNFFFSGLVHAVGAIVPSISRAASASPYSGLTAVVFSLNWLCVPFYFSFMAILAPFWKDEHLDDIVERLKKINKFVVWVMWPIIFPVLIGMDLGLFAVGGPFSMLKPDVFLNFGIVKLLVSHTLTTPALYWLLCISDAGVWFLALFLLTVLIKVIFRKFHVIFHPVKSH